MPSSHIACVTIFIILPSVSPISCQNVLHLCFIVDNRSSKMGHILKVEGISAFSSLYKLCHENL